LAWTLYQSKLLHLSATSFPFIYNTNIMVMGMRCEQQKCKEELFQTTLKTTAAIQELPQRRNYFLLNSWKLHEEERHEHGWIIITRNQITNNFAESWHGETHLFIPCGKNATVIFVQEGCDTVYAVLE
jgi:hypothetical protein